MKTKTTSYTSTPLTDAACKAAGYHPNEIEDCFLAADFARLLERENYRLRAELEVDAIVRHPWRAALEATISKLTEQLEAAERELAEIREFAKSQR